MAKMLFGTADRNAAHGRLAEVLKADPKSAAECREDPNDAEHPYQVWDGPNDQREIEERPGPEVSPEAMAAKLSPEQLDTLAGLIAAKMKGH